MGLCLSSSTCCNSQISNNAECEQGQRALEDQCIIFVIHGFILPKCHVNLKLRENKGVCVIVRKRIQDRLIYTNSHTVSIFNRNLRVQKHRLVGTEHEVWLSKYILSSSLLRSCSLEYFSLSALLQITPQKLSVFHVSVLIHTPLIHQQLSQNL